jgi:hypothetical protein
MSTINFSVPAKVKAAFNRAFSGRNKSAIIAELMQRAVKELRQRQQREALFEALTARRRDRPRVAAGNVRKARLAGRP